MERQGQQRDMVFCHRCENEWYRDEHGLTCPECESDFTEIIEPDHDPREEQFMDEDPPEMAPDPPIEDPMDRFVWRENGPGRFTVNATLYRNFPGPNSGNNEQRVPPEMDAINSIFGGVLRNIGAPNLFAMTPPNQAQGQDQTRTGTPGSREGQRLGGDGPPGGGGSGVRIQHGGGPGYHYTTTTRLTPRDPDMQPDFPVDDLHHMISHLLIGSGRPGGPFHPPNGANGDNARNMAPPPFLGLLGALMGGGGAHGDYAYSQEHLDRILSQLMEQNNMGNAPGPASAEALAALPKVPVDKSMVGESGTADCSVCMEACPVGTEVTKLPCGHWFHEECVKMWLREHDTCPCCRKGINGENQQGQRREGSSSMNMPGAFDSGDNGGRPSASRRSSRHSSTGSSLGDRVRGLFRGSSSNN